MFGISVYCFVCFDAGAVQHTHGVQILSQKTLPKEVIAAFTTPMLRWSNNEMIEYYKEEYSGGNNVLGIDSSNRPYRRSQMIRAFTKFKNNNSAVARHNIPKNKINTYAAVLQVATDLTRVPTTDNEPYVVDSWIDGDTGTVIVLVSTRKLLLNVYRVYNVPGMAPHLSIDMAYRLMQEGHGHMNIGCVSIDQKFHTIAAAVCSRENTSTHQFVLRALKKAVTELVAERRKSGGRID